MFKKRDRVKAVRLIIEAGDPAVHIAKVIGRYLGKEGVVDTVRDGSLPYRVKMEDEIHEWWREEELELVDDNA